MLHRKNARDGEGYFHGSAVAKGSSASDTTTAVQSPRAAVQGILPALLLPALGHQGRATKALSKDVCFTRVYACACVSVGVGAPSTRAHGCGVGLEVFGGGRSKRLQRAEVRAGYGECRGRQMWGWAWADWCVCMCMHACVRVWVGMQAPTLTSGLTKRLGPRLVSSGSGSSARQRSRKSAARSALALNAGAARACACVLAKTNERFGISEPGPHAGGVSWVAQIWAEVHLLLHGLPTEHPECPCVHIHSDSNG